MDSSYLLYKRNEILGVGDVHRFKITLKTKQEDLGKHIHIKIKNNENILLAPAYLNGPYIIYADIRPSNWDNKTQYFSTNDQPHFEPSLNPGQALNHSIILNKIQDEYQWDIDVISQIVFSTSARISFEISIFLGDNTSGDISGMKDGNYSKGKLIVEHMTTLDLWNKPPRSIVQPIHLIILTHGLHSNSTADMCYIRDQLERNAEIITGENIVIRGYKGNVCKTERGVKYLGRRLAEFIVNESMDGLPYRSVKKISFIGHSLGGLIQTFALSYININYPNFFQDIQPENFITMAAPLLGISNENPAYVKLCLSLGIVGKSGQDMNLQGDKPLLLLLPSEPTRNVLKMFKRRSVYANVLNDGIVPLRTSALLYLDWKGLGNVYKALKSEKEHPSTSQISEGDDSSAACEIPNDINSQFDNIEDETKGSGGILGSFKEKVQSAIGFCLPNLATEIKSMPKKYKYFQVQGEGGEEEEEEYDGEEDNENGNGGEFTSMLAIPKSNVITSIKKVILPPLPAANFINDPSNRPESIIHDKIYKPNMLPPAGRDMPSSKILAQLDIVRRHRYLEEKIARRWHLGMSWRKVLAVLEPDAHNNMVVRRRFANAYGWQAVDNVIEHHFSLECVKGQDSDDWVVVESGDSKSTEIDLDIEETRRLDRVLEKEFKKEHPNGLSDVDDSWLNESVHGYYDGPTGMINNVGESVVESVEVVKRGLRNVYGTGEETEVSHERDVLEEYL